MLININNKWCMFTKKSRRKECFIGSLGLFRWYTDDLKIIDLYYKDRYEKLNTYKSRLDLKLIGL